MTTINLPFISGSCASFTAAATAAPPEIPQALFVDYVKSMTLGALGALERRVSRNMKGAA